MTARIKPGYANSNVVILDRTTKTPWQKAMGDWLDADGVLNGPKPTRSPTGATATVDITGFDAALIQGANSVSQVVVDGVDVTSKCFWTDPSSNASIAMPSHYGNPVIVPVAGSSMTVTSNATKAYRVDPVACPPVPDLPVDASYYRAPDLLRVNPTSYDALLAPPGRILPGVSIFGNPDAAQYITEQGVPLVQCKTQPAPYFPTIGRGRTFRVDYPVGAQTELHVAYLLKIGADVWAACADLGVKLSGPTGDEGVYFVGEHSCAASIGGTANPLNPGIFAIWDYFADAIKGFQQTPDTSYARFMDERYVLVELGASCNTFDASGKPNVDGLARMWINGVPVLDTRRAWFKSPASRWNIASIQIYQGGTQSYRSPGGTYYLGPCMASTQHIGVPPDIAPLLGAPLAVPVTPVDPRDAQIAALTQQLAAAQAATTQAQAAEKAAEDALAQEKAKRAQLNADIDAVQAKDA